MDDVAPEAGFDAPLDADEALEAGGLGAESMVCSFTEKSWLAPGADLAKAA